MPDPKDDPPPAPGQPADLLRVLIFGAGAIGTYVGGSLALHGYPVTFTERPEIAAAVRQQGLRLNLKGVEEVVPLPQIASSLEDALAKGPFDLGVFALKSFDTQDALRDMAPYSADLPALVCLQNGVDNEAALAAALGPAKVIAGTVTSAIGRRAAGDIILERLRGLGIAQGHPLSAQFVEALNHSGLNARLYPSAAGMKWSKMVTNLLANATSAILDMAPAEVIAHSGLYRLEVEQIREALRVMDALQIHAVNLPATPVRALTYAIRLLPPAVSRPVLTKAVGGGRGGKMPSFHIDLHSGRGRVEVDYLNGAVVRHGREAGVPTPVNEFLNSTLLRLAGGELPLDSYAHQPEKLLRALETYDQPAQR